MLVMDTQYELLRLYATKEAQLSLSACQLGQLLQSSGYSDDPANCVLSWQLLVVLKAVGVLAMEDIEGSSQVRN